MMEWENKLYQILLKEQEAEAVVDDSYKATSVCAGPRQRDT